MKQTIITYHLADAAEQRPTTPWIPGICTFTAPVAARFSGIRHLSCRII